MLQCQLWYVLRNKCGYAKPHRIEACFLKNGRLLCEYYTSNEGKMKLNFKLISYFFCVATTLSGAPAFAGGGASFFLSNAPSNQLLTPGQTTSVTLTSGVSQGTITSLATNNPDYVVVGGTCVVGQSYASPQTCTVIVRFTGAVPGSTTALLTGTCTAVAAVGGFSMTCGNPASTLAQFSGNGAAAVITQAVNTLSPAGLAALVSLMLGVGAFLTLRR